MSYRETRPLKRECEGKCAPRCGLGRGTRPGLGCGIARRRPASMSERAERLSLMRLRNIIITGYLYASPLGSWAYVYFLSFITLASTLALNVLTAVFITAFTTRAKVQRPSGRGRRMPNQRYRCPRRLPSRAVFLGQLARRCVMDRVSGDRSPSGSQWVRLSGEAGLGAIQRASIASRCWLMRVQVVSRATRQASMLLLNVLGGTVGLVKTEGHVEGNIYIYIYIFFLQALPTEG